MMIKKYGFVKAIVGSSVRVRIDGGVEKWKEMFGSQTKGVSK